MSGKQRFRELDGLRGIAALAVVLTHYTMNFDLFFRSIMTWAGDLNMVISVSTYSS